MGYWRPSGRGFVAGVPAVNYSDAAMAELDATHPGIRDGGAFERVDDAMPADEPKATPSDVEAMTEEEGSEDA